MQVTIVFCFLDQFYIFTINFADGNSDTVPELDDVAMPPTVNNVQPSPLRAGIKLKSNSISEDTSEPQVR